MPDIITIGEAQVEFVSIEPGVTLSEARAFEKKIGATPLNVALGVARQRVSSGFIGRVGDDPFGRFLADTLVGQGVDVSQLAFEPKARTSLAFISLRSDGERDYLFFRHPSADLLLSPGHINPSYIKSARAIFYDSMSLTGEPCRSAVLKALAIARDAGVLRVYDTNLRLSLWGSEAEARYGLGLGLDRADIAKLNLDELEFMSGTRDPMQGLEKLWNEISRKGNGLRLMIVTMGAQGCAYRTPTETNQLPGYSVEAIDAAGAGDGFLVGLLAELVATGLSSERDKVEQTLRFANAAGALTTTQSGITSSLPTRHQVEALIDTQP
jgi:fructokinase